MEKRDEIAKYLMSDARKKRQNPEIILNSLSVKKGMTLADLGCGLGFFTIPLAELTGETGLVYVVDSDPTMLSHLRDNIAKSGVHRNIIKIINSDVTETGIPKNSVDIAFFANMLHDIYDKTAFFEEIKRICKPTASVIDVD
jgi:ubiquinone/menaquinone biosynthesis C-methylase UbiE